MSRLTVFLVVQVSVATLCFLKGYNTAGCIILALATLDVLMNVYKHLQASFTPSMRLVEVVNNGGDVKYQAQIKDTFFGSWWCVSYPHSSKEWVVENGQRELIRALEIAIAKEKAKVVTTRVVPIDIDTNKE